jgi:hypothetical protein
MTTDEKINEILVRLSRESAIVLVDIQNICAELNCDKQEYIDITRRLEFEGLANSSIFGRSMMTGSDLGRKLGRHSDYVNWITDKRQKENSFNTDNKDLKTGRRIDRTITGLSVLAAIILGTWNNVLNQDVKDVKISIDSMRVEMREFRKIFEKKAEINTTKSKHISQEKSTSNLKLPKKLSE